MSNRVSQAVLLCEDATQERLVRAFLKECGIKNPDRYLRTKVASKEKQGGGISWVIEKFPDQLLAVRNRQKARAETLLIVMIDADKNSIEERREELNDRAQLLGHEKIGQNEIALLIPKYHVETWIRVLLGETVTEDEDCKGFQKPTKEEIRQAAENLFELSRPNAPLASNCIPSLLASLPVWRMLSDRLR